MSLFADKSSPFNLMHSNVNCNSWCNKGPTQEGFSSMQQPGKFSARGDLTFAPRFPGYQSSISWKEIGRWGGPLWLHGFAGKLKIAED